MERGAAALLDQTILAWHLVVAEVLLDWMRRAWRRSPLLLLLLPQPLQLGGATCRRRGRIGWLRLPSEVVRAESEHSLWLPLALPC